MAANLIPPPDGVFQAKFNTGSDGWSVILPYVDRRKYTIGEKYTSWETQGDFFFFTTDEEEWNWSFGLQIMCDLDSYWVKPFKGGGVSKNGEMLDDKVKTRLKFGDIFTVTKLRNDISSNVAIFTFEKRTYPKNWDKLNICASDNATGSNFTPDQNQLVFSHILSYLSVGSLKNARLVCRHWEEQVTPTLQKKCVINFRGCSYACNNPSMRFLRYIHEIRHVEDWPNWKMHFPSLTPKKDDEENWSAKYVADLNLFLHPRRGHHVKTLSLQGYIDSDQDYGLYLDTVSRFKDILEELCLDFNMSKDYSPRKSYLWPRDLFFPLLKKFSLRFHTHFGDPPPATLSTNWMKTWTNAIKGVTSISILADGFQGSRFVQALQTTGTLSYTNLREIQLTCKSEEGINFLTEVNHPLKKLTLTLPLETRHLPGFEDLLKKFAMSLEFLKFRVATAGLEEESRFILNLPCFPKLKSLDLHFGAFETPIMYISGVEDVPCLIKNVARLSLAFPPDDNGIDYGRHLPGIRSIVVKPWIRAGHEDDFWDTYSTLIDSLLPKENGQCCKTLENLVIFRDDIQPASDTVKLDFQEYFRTLGTSGWTG